MVEAGSLEVSEETVADALQFGHDQVRKIIAVIRELHSKINPSKVDVAPLPFDQELAKQIERQYGERLHDALDTAKYPKKESYRRVGALREALLATIPEEEEERRQLADRALERLREKYLREDILHRHRRPDGRAFDQVRTITCEVGLLPRVHGSALFTRGETQALATVTLGTKEDMQRLDLLFEEEAFKRFMLHYNFPPFSTGEVKFLRGPGRREVGHGNLALRSLKQMMPKGDFAYTVRVVSDILESNGSSSMATVCAGSLALMDSGIPVAKHVGGVAMGLITKEGKYAVLTDILGDEDHLGDMDFKVTGTKDGICGIQMDIKVDGLSMDTMREALQQARKGRLHILDAMYACMPASRPEVKPHAPRMEKLFIDKEFIGAVIGPGGKIIQEIQRETGTTINIEEVGNYGEVSIFSPAKEGLEKAVAWEKGITAVPEVGEVYESKVKT